MSELYDGTEEVAFANGTLHGAAQERAKIVAWLRQEVAGYVCDKLTPNDKLVLRVMTNVADAIERGEHES